MVKNVIFDLGRVLIEFEPESYMKQMNISERDRAILSRELFRSVEWISLDRGTITYGEAWRRIRRRLPTELLEKGEELLYHWYKYMRVIDGMEELTAELKAGGYRVLLLSNLSKLYEEYIDLIPAIKNFDGLFLSCDWGLLKPESEIYRAFIAHFGIVPRESVFIDDLPINIESAMRAGLGGIIYNGDISELRQRLIGYGVDIHP